MRILMLAQFYQPIIGGEETYVRNLSIALAQRGHEVAVATLWNQGLPEFEIVNGVRVYRIRGTVQHIPALYSDGGRRHAPPMPDPGLTLALREIIKKERPEIVHAHNWIVRSFIPLKAWSGAKLVMSLHDYSLICARKNLMYKGTTQCSGPSLSKCIDCSIEHYGMAKGIPTAIANLIMGSFERSSVDMFVPVSGAVAESDGLVGGHWPYQVIPNFLLDDTATLKETDITLLDQLPKGPFILFVGDLSLFKGLGVLLSAYAKLTNAPPLILIGRQLPETPTDLPPNVKILNSWPHDAVMHAWSRCTIGLAPSVHREAFGFVVLEAMTMGRPVIASRIGGIPDMMIDGETGYLTPPGDADAVEAALRRLLADPDLCEQMGQASARRAELFKASSVVPRIEQLYKELLTVSDKQGTVK